MKWLVVNCLVETIKAALERRAAERCFSEEHGAQLKTADSSAKETSSEFDAASKSINNQIWAPKKV